MAWWKFSSTPVIESDDADLMNEARYAEQWERYDVPVTNVAAYADADSGAYDVYESDNDEGYELTVSFNDRAGADQHLLGILNARWGR